MIMRNVTICVVGGMAAALIFAGSVPGEKIWPSVVDEQIAEAKESAEFKSDP
jgi:hypothetical protein